MTAVAALCAAALGCASTSSTAPAAPPGVVVAQLAVTSGAIPSGGMVPVDFTCDGANHSPPLTFSAPPRGTASLAVVFDDPDASGFTHAESGGGYGWVKPTAIASYAGSTDKFDVAPSLRCGAQ